MHCGFTNTIINVDVLFDNMHLDPYIVCKATATEATSAPQLQLQQKRGPLMRRTNYLPATSAHQVAIESCLMAEAM
jgi:hypothetical protein